MSTESKKTTNLKFVVLGYDPGGVGKSEVGNNGAAIITMEQGVVISTKVGSLKSVDETFNWFKENIGDEIEVKAAGIDTLLSWSTGVQGLRRMDQHLREKYPEVRQSIIASNGLYGAMVVQGMSMAIRLREKWNQLILNETHPKVQYYAQAEKPYKFEGEIIKWLRGQINCADFPQKCNEHEWDALYSAWTTLRAIQNRSTPDLLDITNSRASPSMLYPVGSVHYYWPSWK